MRPHIVVLGLIGLGLSVTSLAEPNVPFSQSGSERISFFDLSTGPHFSPFDGPTQYGGKPSTLEDFSFLAQIDARLKAAQVENQPDISAPLIPEGKDFVETKVNEGVPVVIPGDVVGETGSLCLEHNNLEPLAMLGRLTITQLKCVKARMTTSKRLVDKDPLSRILIVNAFASGRSAYAQHLRYHLEQIDRSDPDLAYKYAYLLHKQGPVRAKEVLRWADVALKGKSRWSEKVYVRRVNATMKLRALAAYERWKSAEEVYAKTPSTPLAGKKERLRGQAKTIAREWLEFTRAAEKDPYSALKLCLSVASTEAYCL